MLSLLEVPAMKSSQLNTLGLPLAGSPNPATLTKAADTPLRVVIRNVGPVTVMLAHDVGTLSNGPVFANAYQLLPDRETVIILAPQQGIFAAGLGLGGTLSIAVSDAIPALRGGI
jgi:hypothetical protein